MRLSDDIRKTVVFIGYADPADPSDFTCIGTAFLVGHNHISHLVTVKHVALDLGDDPFSIRMNDGDGGCHHLKVEGTTESHLTWHFHPDPDVDLAVSALRFDARKHGADVLHLPSEMIMQAWQIEDNLVGIGDMVYTVGLFKLMSGRNRNLPIVHTGNIAMLPGDERVPIHDWEKPKGRRWVEAYLVESQSLDGLSGSPVFARPTMELHFSDAKVAIAPHQKLLLLGIWQAAWDAKPDEVLASGVGRNVKVPVGLGVVVPAPKLLELLEDPKLKQERKDKQEESLTEETATLERTTVGQRTTAGNPTHLEDFNRLLGAAAKKPLQAD